VQAALAAATWNNAPAAVRFITHSSADDEFLFLLLFCDAACVLAAAATWNNAPVAVKIITHSSADDKLLFCAAVL
jgi:hypothetical protein